MSNPYCSACHRNRPTEDFHDGDMICYRHYIEPDYSAIADAERAKEAHKEKLSAAIDRKKRISIEMAKPSLVSGQRFCKRCMQCRPVTNFPSDSPDICYRHIQHFIRLGHKRALAEIRGEPIPRVQKTREELDVALRRRRREKQKELDAMPGRPDRRLVKRGGDRTPRNDF